MIERKKPANLVVFEGFNDVLLGRSAGSIGFNAQEIMVKCFFNETKPFIAGILENSLFPERIRRANVEIEKSCRRIGFRYIDVMKFFPKEFNDIFYSNMFFPNDKGYELISYSIYDSLRKKK